MRLPFMYCARVSGLPAISPSKSARFLSLFKNHLSILVTEWISSTVIPRFIALNTTNSLSSVSSCSLARISSSVSSVILGMLSVPSEISAPRTAFIMAISKPVPIAITSPVAFMRVPSVRFA